jgi:aryl-alcohol dehydrogenase-like predicted oxidoreductase
MKKRTFGKTKLEVTPLGFGGAEIGMLDQSQDEVTKLLNDILDAGINVIDTAAMYKTSEELIGAAIGKRRDEYILISKCGTEVPDISKKAWSADLIRLSVDRSLKNLRTDHLDVMLLHSCDVEVLRKGAALDALISARDAGKIRFIGYSGDNEASAWAAAQPELDVVQTSISICDQINAHLALPVCRENKVGVMAKRPIANAAWRELDAQPGMYQDYAKTYTERLRRMGISPADFGFDGAPDEAWPEMALRFTLSQPGVHTAIIGTTSRSNVQANLAAAEKEPLAPEIIERLYDAFRRAEEAEHARWEGQT